MYSSGFQRGVVIVLKIFSTSALFQNNAGKFRFKTIIRQRVGRCAGKSMEAKKSDGEKQLRVTNSRKGNI